ncbi:MAG: FAD-dependent oxidoreductase, partial [Chloroflexota bacterium]
RALDAYGVVIPAREGRRIDGMQWSSAKWANRAPEGISLLRVFFGGPHTRNMLNLDDTKLETAIREELRDVLDITAAPLHTTIGRWRNAYPQYDVGHIERVKRIMDGLPDGIALAGNAYLGVGVPNTIQSAQEAVVRLTAIDSGTTPTGES